MMRLIFTVFLSLLTLVEPVWAATKPRGCFTAPEISAERLVRQGLRLREGANACNGNPWNYKTLPLWTDIDTRFGWRFAQQTKIRKGAFIREFDKDAENRITQWDGRTVMFYRTYPLSDEYCAGVKKQLLDMQKSGWAVFVKAASVAPEEIKTIYNPCH